MNVSTQYFHDAAIDFRAPATRLNEYGMAFLAFHRLLRISKYRTGFSAFANDF